MNRLLAFYSGSAPDHRGRYLRDILRQDDRWLETTHDYVQWLFPLPEPSGALPSAPLIDAEVTAAFAADERLRQALHASLVRMLCFYGLGERDGRVTAGANWGQRKAHWFTRPTHNNLRITRILKSLCALGLRTDAARLHAGLEALRASEQDCGVGADTFDYWRAAVAGERSGWRPDGIDPADNARPAARSAQEPAS
jgi:hypothetical protein